MSAAPAPSPPPTTPDTRNGLCATILGPHWPQVHETVRRMHDPRGLRARGLLKIELGPSRFSGLLARIGGLPRPSPAAPVELIITANPTGETWHRSFATHVLITTQTSGPHGHLYERFGPILLTLRLEPREGGLAYLPHAAALQIGPLRIPLPRFLSPTVTAFERPAPEPAPEPGRILITVHISLPIFGRIMSYDGWIREQPR